MIFRRKKNIALLLNLSLGIIGIHNFYLGKTSKGFLYLLLFWTLIPFFASIFDFFSLLRMSEEEFNSLYNSQIDSSSRKKISH